MSQVFKWDISNGEQQSVTGVVVVRGRSFNHRVVVRTVLTVTVLVLVLTWLACKRKVVSGGGAYLILGYSPKLVFHLINCPRCHGPTELVGRSLRWRKEGFDLMLDDYHCVECGTMWQRTGETGVKMEEKSQIWKGSYART